MRGFDLSEAALATALEMGAIDEACTDIERVMDGAETCFVCCPVSALPSVALEALEVSSDCTVSDVGSTKRAVLEEIDAANLAAGDVARFVGGHPLAGAEASGVEYARADLFQGATWYLMPTERTSGVLYERHYRMLSELGARPVAINADTHDRMMATVSHLPHVLANVLVGQASRALLEEGQSLPAAGPSFRDATRVAGANPAIWGDIFTTNRGAIATELEACIRDLEGVLDDLRSEDPAKIERWIEQARTHRQRLLELDLAGGPVAELRVSVPNRPGIVAEVALALGEAGVNIVDMALYPAADMQSGAIALWVAGEGGAKRAVDLIGKLGHPVAVVEDPDGS